MHGRVIRLYFPFFYVGIVTPQRSLGQSANALFECLDYVCGGRHVNSLCEINGFVHGFVRSGNALARCGAVIGALLKPRRRDVRNGEGGRRGKGHSISDMRMPLLPLPVLGFLLELLAAAFSMLARPLTTTLVLLTLTLLLLRFVTVLLLELLVLV